MKNKLDEQLKETISAYDSIYNTMTKNGEELGKNRCGSVGLIDEVEKFVNSIAHRPKSFDKDIETIRVRKEEFTSLEEYARKEATNAKVSAGTAVAGLSAGTAVAAIGPSAAMWVATTFGTASTGTAISALSGAAATKAALAWLGGGAIAAGGGGVAAGNAFLTMCGPVGWGIAIAAAGLSIALIASGKHRQNKKKEEEIEKLKNYTSDVRKINLKIRALIRENAALHDKLLLLYRDCLRLKNADFESMSKDEQLRLGELVNNTRSLSACILKKAEI